MVDIMAVREAYACHGVDNVVLVESKYNPADGLTKEHPNEAVLDVMTTRSSSHPIKQYVITS